MPIIGYGLDDNYMSIPFQLINGLIVIEAEIDNEVGNYIFDTGAEELILNKEAGSGKTLFSSINGDINTSEVNINLLKIGNLTHSKFKAYAADLSSMQSYLNMTLHGIIGCELLLPKQVRINFFTKTIELSDRFDLTLDNQKAVSFSIVDGVPVFPVTINGKQYQFGFDTGATMHVLDSRLYDELKSSLFDTGLDTYVSTGTGEKSVNKIVSMIQYRMGNVIQLDHDFLLQSLDDFNQSMQSNIDGVLSIISLKSEHVTIDFPNRKIYF